MENLKWVASLRLRHKEHNNDPQPLHNLTHQKMNSLGCLR